MSECQRTLDRLASYVDRLLSPDERADVDRHLDACAPCRTIAAREHGGHTVLRQESTRLRTDALPPGLRTRCEALAREHVAARARTPFLVGSWRSRLVPTMLGVVVLVFSASAI